MDRAKTPKDREPNVPRARTSINDGRSAMNDETRMTGVRRAALLQVFAAELRTTARGDRDVAGLARELEQVAAALLVQGRRRWQFEPSVE
jgi:hypothetical protein